MGGVGIKVAGEGGEGGREGGRDFGLSIGGWYSTMQCSTGGGGVG